MVPDARFNKLVEMYKPTKSSGATLLVTDIAGLVPGASQGEGLGNAFLSHIQAVDGIYEVVRTFDDPNIVHTQGEVNPINDLETIKTELIAKDLQHVTVWIEDADKAVKRVKDKNKEDELAVLQKVLTVLEEKKFVKDVDWNPNEIEELNKHLLLTAKPIIYLLNMSIEEYKKKKNKHLKNIVEWINAHGGGTVIPYSAAYEELVVAAEDKEQFCKDEGAPSAINKIIKAGYQSLGLIHFFTTLNNDLRCWSIRTGTVAKKAAGQVHTDMEEGFIAADVIKYSDLFELGSEAAVKAAGKMKKTGKDYVVEDGDIMFFKFNPSKKKK
jgi:obg-like ATPase 1